jgi:hypothetical protein
MKWKANFLDNTYQGDQANQRSIKKGRKDDSHIEHWGSAAAPLG